jgi:hypothetical protein
MKIVKKYSHLNGEEYLIVHKKALYEEIQEAIASVDASRFKTKVSKERGRQGEMLYSPGDLNKEFERVFGNLGWQPVTRQFFVSDNYEIVKTIEPMDYEEQKAYLESIDVPLIRSYNQTDFVKDNVAVEVQFGKYFVVTYDLFVKHLSFYTGGIIDVGVEIVPSKEMQRHMSSGPPFFEKEVHNVMRHGRTTPPVPVIMLGIEPENL